MNVNGYGNSFVIAYIPSSISWNLCI